MPRSAVLPVALGAALGLSLAAMEATAQQRAAQAQTQAPQQPRPESLGNFGDWIAATYQDGGQKICYAFVRASRSEPNRPGVIMTVTHRARGRDTVAMKAGHSFSRGAEVEVQVGSTELPFYTGNDSAFARDNRAAIAAFRAGREAVAKGPGPGGRGTATDTFSLSGFTAAYEAISRACPPGGGGRR
jgi:hypothetical protein